MTREIFVFGGGGHAREVLQLLQDANTADPRGAGWETAGVMLDAAFPNPGDMLKNVPVYLGEDAWPEPDGAAIVVAVGASNARQHIVRRLVARGWSLFPSLVHPRAWISPAASLGEGCVIFAGALINTDVTLGDHVHVNLGCSISHDSVLQDFVTLGPGVRICGNGQVGEASELGAAAVLVPRARVGDRAIIGAGAVVLDHVPSDVTAVGVPARVLPQRNRP